MFLSVFLQQDYVLLDPLRYSVLKWTRVKPSATQGTRSFSDIPTALPQQVGSLVHNELLANDDMGRGSEIECHMEYVTLTLMTIRLHSNIHRMLYTDT